MQSIDRTDFTLGADVAEAVIFYRVANGSSVQIVMHGLSSTDAIQMVNAAMSTLKEDEQDESPDKPR